MAKDMPKKDNSENTATEQTEQTAQVAETAADSLSKNGASKKAESKKPNAAQTPSFRAQAEKSSNPKASKTVKKGKDGKPKKNIFKRMFNGIKSVVSELKKVTWPKGKSVVANTVVVLLFVLVFLVVIFIFDYVLSGLLSLLISNKWVSLIG